MHRVVSEAVSKLPRREEDSLRSLVHLKRLQPHLLTILAGSVLRGQELGFRVAIIVNRVAGHRCGYDGREGTTGNSVYGTQYTYLVG